MKNTYWLPIGVALLGFFFWIFLKDFAELPLMREWRFDSVVPLVALAALPNFLTSFLIGSAVRLAARNVSIHELIASALVLVSAQIIYSWVTGSYQAYDLRGYVFLLAPFVGSLLGYLFGVGAIALSLRRAKQRA
jgi:hypothetical protein